MIGIFITYLLLRTLNICSYLTGKIQEGEAHNITCPGYECSKLVPVDLIETLVSRDMARRYLQFDIKVSDLFQMFHSVIFFNLKGLNPFVSNR